MTPDEHKRAAELFHKVRGLSPTEQSSLLEEAYPFDLALRQHVMRLLAADQEAEQGTFLARPALQDAVDQVILTLPDGLPLVGTVLGKYRLTRQIGAGGMGVVYEAEDLHLRRRVAVKVLAKAATSVADEQIKRFEREARAAGQLNHPHIAAVFEAGSAQGFHYIAMEFVEGRTLRTVVNTDAKRIDWKTVLELISQTASALSAAHEAGIIHRDIKPENIIVRPDGFVKVLDFGLAAVREPTSGEGLDLRTRPGHVAGTIQYLSPEQVFGNKAQPQSDLFSLGVVAYELATGVRPFDGPSDGAIFDAILHFDPPPPSAARPALGPELDVLIMQALEKDPELRFQTASDLRSACRRLTKVSSTPTYIARPAGRKGLRPWLGPWAAALLGSLLFGVLFWYLAPPRRLPSPSLSIHVQQLTDSPGEENFPSFTANGEQFVYASARSGKWEIYLQRIGGSAFVNLTNGSTGDNRQPAVSPDGAKIAFRAERDGGGIFVMDSTGENPRRITTVGYLPAWAPDSRHLAYTTHTFNDPNQVPYPPSDMYIADIETGAPTKVPAVDGFQPNWSPHGGRIAYWSVSTGGRRDIYTVDADGKKPPVAVTADAAVDWNPVWAPSGLRLWFLSDRGGTMNLCSVPIDEKSGRVQGRVEPFTLPAHFVGNLAVSRDGNSFIFSDASHRYHLGRIQFDATRRLTTGTPEAVAGSRVIADFRFSPDGSRIAFDTLGDVNENLWIMKADGSDARSLTFGGFRNRSPEWSPDGQQLVFFSNRGGDGYNDWLINSDGSGLRPLTRNANPPMQGGFFLPDGKRIVAWDTESLGFLNPKELLPRPGLAGTPERFFAKGCYCDEPAKSSDRESLLCHLPGGEVVIYYPAEHRLERTGAFGGSYATWLPAQGNPRRSHADFLFVRGGDCLLYNCEMRRETKLFSMAPNQLYVLNLSPDKRYLYFSEKRSESDLYFARTSP